MSVTSPRLSCHGDTTNYNNLCILDGGASVSAGRLLIILLSVNLSRNYHIKNVVLFEENSILLLPESLEASGVKSVWGEVSQENR